MTEYWTDFVQESTERITELNNELLALERDPDDEEAMENIFRIAHTLKGNCGAAGLEAASDLAHAIEDVLDAVRSGGLDVTPELMDDVFEAVDELETMVGEVDTRGEIETDPSPTIDALRAHIAAATAGISSPTTDEIETVLSRFDPPADDTHNAYFVRLSIAESEHEHENNGILVVEALIDAFDLIGTAPPRDVIAADNYGGQFDAVFGSPVGKSAIESGLEPVEEVAEFEIADVTDQFEAVAAADDAERSGTANAAGTLSGTGAEVPGADISPDEAQDLEVDELLDEFNEFDDLDELVEEVEDDDLDAFEDMGDAGSFDDLLEDEEDIDLGLESDLGEEPSTGRAESTTEPAAGDDSSPDGTPSDDGTAGTDASADDDDVDDAEAVFEELKAEVDTVGFDELQDELEELEFDEFDQEDEVGMDELLGDDIDADDGAFLEEAEPSDEEIDDILVDSSDVSDEDASVDAGPDGETIDDQPDERDDKPATTDHATQSTKAEATAPAVDEPTDDSFEDEAVDWFEDDDDGWLEDDDDGLFGDEATDSTEGETASVADPDPADEPAALEEPEADAVESAGRAEADVDDGVDEPTPEDAGGTEADADVTGSETAASESGVDTDTAETTDEFTAAEPVDAAAFSPETDVNDGFGDDADATSSPVSPVEDVDDDFGADADSGPVSPVEDAEDGFDDADEFETDFEETTEFADFSSGLDDESAAEPEPELDAELPTEPTEAADSAPPAEEPSDSIEDEDTADGSIDVDDTADDSFEDAFGEGGFDDIEDEPLGEPDAFGTEPESSDGFSGFDANSSSASGDESGIGQTDGTADQDGGSEERRVVEEPTLEIPDITVPERDQRRETDDETDDIQSVRVGVEQIDDLLNLVEGLVTSRVRLRHEVESNVERELAAIEAELDDLEELTRDLQETVMDVRLVPLQTVANRLPRVVRDIARDQGKEVAFEMTGETVELDRTILDRIRDPLVHLVRNAVDHGIEPPEERETDGKDREGRVEVTATRSRDQVTITVSDDGSGLDPDRLRSEAIEAGVLSEDEAAEMDDDEAMQLVFHPGLSTADEVTDVSGRGVGMDVVKRTIEDLDGTVSIDSDPGDGTTVTMTVPVSIAIDDVLFIESGGEEFGIPTTAVADVGPATELESVDGELTLPDDESYSVIQLAETLEIAADDPEAAVTDGMVVRIREDVRPVALHCDTVRGQQEVVVKPFEGFMGDIPGLGGATVRGRGKVVNILDVTTL
ncbi:chemotaxis protein CheA [Halopiger djelfimassiliensis]|uniref:chemotaxis protein CheA n=1 Tax=Halopiger djelfimassiliensis TaxID=1293047 RepID=UPI0006777713|nr:chemotaxis protein CheA [Halopiger djelfimassiliensis]